MDKKSIQNRKRCATSMRRCFIMEAVASGLTRDLELTWDGGHDFPNVYTDPHVAEFHARGTIIRKSIPERTINGIWQSDESLRVIRRVVQELLKH